MEDELKSLQDKISDLENKLTITTTNYNIQSSVQTKRDPVLESNKYTPQNSKSN